MNKILSGAALVLSAALAGCATPGPAPVDVTRFHLNQPIARGQIAIEPTDPADANSLEFRTYADAVARQLSAQGFTVVPAGRSEQVAQILVERGSRQALRERSPVSIGIGGGTGGWSSGVGGGVSFGLGGSRSGEVVGTRLSVTIKRRSDGTRLWEGRAETEARADRPEADPRIAVEELAAALFAGFPGESGRTIRV